MKTIHRLLSPLLFLLIALLSFGQAFAEETTYNVDSLSIDGGASADGGRIVIAATLGGLTAEE